jgi:hypothetical protein
MSLKGNEMKVHVKQDVAAAIRAGIEPSELTEIDLPISLLTAEQRDYIADRRHYVWPVTKGTPEEVIAVLDKDIAEYKRCQAEAEAEVKVWLKEAKPQPKGHRSEEGISWMEYAVYYPNCYSQGIAAWADKEMSEKVAKRYAELEAECKKLNAESRAKVQPQIDRIKAQREERARIEAEHEMLATKAKEEERLKTGIVRIHLERGTRSTWGEPWIAIVIPQNGRRPEYDFSKGKYDETTEELSIPAKPGDVIAYGQRNYKKASDTIHHVVTFLKDGSFKE